MRFAICDDEETCRENIINNIALTQNKNIQIEIFEFSSGEDLVDSYEKGNRYDVIFLDVEMRQMSGVEAGQAIRKLDNEVIFIFITGHTKYVPEAFILNAFQFLVKPLNQEVFNKELERTISTFLKKKFKYRIDYKNETTVLEIKDILYIETYNRHLRAVTATNKYEYIGKLSQQEKKLIEYDFVRCHQGYIVNMQNIKTIEKNSFILFNNEQIPISKYLKSEVTKKYNKFISGCVL